MEFNKKILNTIVCPLSKERLVYDEEKNCLIAKQSRLAYPVRNGIPIMIVEEAKKLD